MINLLISLLWCLLFAPYVRASFVVAEASNTCEVDSYEPIGDRTIRITSYDNLHVATLHLDNEQSDMAQQLSLRCAEQIIRSSEVALSSYKQVALSSYKQAYLECLSTKPADLKCLEPNCNEGKMPDGTDCYRAQGLLRPGCNVYESRAKLISYSEPTPLLIEAWCLSLILESKFPVASIEECASLVLKHADKRTDGNRDISYPKR